MTNKDYERLTYRPYIKDKVRCLQPDGKLQDLAERLYKLENSIENGTLVFLPCKVDDTVYFVNRWSSIPRIEAWHISAIEITSDGIEIGAYRISNQNQKGLFRVAGFGNEVFITKEAAEKALEELEK